MAKYYGILILKWVENVRLLSNVPMRLFHSQWEVGIEKEKVIILEKREGKSESSFIFRFIIFSC